MKISVLLFLITLLTALLPCSGSAEEIICKDATPGGLYIVGPDISSDSLPGNFLYYSANYGSTLVLKDYDTTGYIKFANITADSTIGGVYQRTTGEGLYYSINFGRNWSFHSSFICCELSSGLIPGEIYTHHSNIERSVDYGITFNILSPILFSRHVLGRVSGEINGITQRGGELYFSSDSGVSFELVQDFPGNNWDLTRGALSGEIYCFDDDSIYYSANFGSTFAVTGYCGYHSSDWEKTELCGGNEPGELFCIRTEHYIIPMVHEGGGEIEICYSTDYGATWDCVFHSSRDTRIEEGGISIKPEGMEIEVYPNPFNAILNIKFALVRAIGQSPLQMEIFDINGRLVFTDRQGCLSIQGRDAYLYRWEPHNLPSGIYLIKISNGEKVEARKVLYLK